MSDFNSFKSRLLLAVKKSLLSNAEIARRADISPQLLNNWLKKDQDNLPAANYLARLASVLNVNLLWLITGNGSIEKSNVLVLEDQNSNDFIQIPEYKVNFGAGDCFEPTYEEVHEIAPTAYRRDFFLNHGLDYKQCKRLRVKGNSMEPIIQDGDCILVDCSPVTQIDNGAIYALIYDDTLKVKRLIKDFNTLIIKSDNKDYPDITVSADEANQKIFIVGKVIERSGVI